MGCNNNGRKNIKMVTVHTFKDQINKVGLMSSPSVLQSYIYLEDLEVLLYFTVFSPLDVIIVLGCFQYIYVAWLPALT